MRKIFLILFLFSYCADAQNPTVFGKTVPLDSRNITVETRTYPLSNGGYITSNMVDTTRQYLTVSYDNLENYFKVTRENFLKNDIRQNAVSLYLTKESSGGFPIINFDTGNVFTGDVSSVLRLDDLIGKSKMIDLPDPNIFLNPIKFFSYADRGEVVYKNREEISSFVFYDHELLSKNGTSLAIEKTIVSGSISPLISAMSGNGAYTVRQGVYEQVWQGSDGSNWATLTAPRKSEAAKFVLNTSANLAENNTNGAFVINTGGNSFSFHTSGSIGIVGWDKSIGTLSLAATLIETDAQIIQNGLFKSTIGIAVSDANDLLKLSIGENVQGFFSSNKNGRTGIVIENLNTDSNSCAAITIRQQGITNWIGTMSQNSLSKLYSPGSLVMKSEGDILLSTSSPINGNYGQLRFAVDNNEIARFTRSSLLIGTILEISSSALTVESESQGVLFPRLTAGQIKYIVKPEEGLLMYNKDRKKFWFYDGRRYQELCSRSIPDL